MSRHTEDIVARHRQVLRYVIAGIVRMPSDIPAKLSKPEDSSKAEDDAA